MFATEGSGLLGESSLPSLVDVRKCTSEEVTAALKLAVKQKDRRALVIKLCALQWPQLTVHKCSIIW